VVSAQLITEAAVKSLWTNQPVTIEGVVAIGLACPIRKPVHSISRARGFGAATRLKHVNCASQVDRPCL